MANTKISALPAAATITGTEMIPLVQTGTTVAATVQQLLALIVAGAPGNLDTFFETATQLGLDETTVATLQTLVAGKADTASVAATYAPRDAAVRVSAATLPTWVRKLQLSLLGQSPTRLLCIGDSTTAGVYSDSYTTATGSTNQGGPNSYPARLAQYLTGHGIPAVYGMGIPGHQYNDDSRWTLSGSAGYYPMGAGSNAGIELDIPNGSVTFTPGDKADRFRLYYFGDPGTGTLSAQATGGAATTVTTTTAGNGGIYTSADISAGPPAATNTITITNMAGTSFLVGVEYWDSTNPNVVRILPAGVGASTANTWANDANSTKYGGIAFTQAASPDLTVVSLGINDLRGGRTPSQIVADATTIAAAAAASGDVLIVSAVPGPDGSEDDLNADYLATTYPYVDLAHRYGHAMQARGLMTVDGTHPNALGYSDIAATIGEALNTAAAGQAAPAPTPALPGVHFAAASLGNDGTTAWSAGSGGLTTIPLVLATTSDNSNWDSAAHSWTIPVKGLYQLTGTLRPTDGYTPGSNIGIGVDSSQNGGANFIWCGVTTASRHTFLLSRSAFFQAGDKVSMFGYFEGSGDVGMAAMNIALIAATGS